MAGSYNRIMKCVCHLHLVINGGGHIPALEGDFADQVADFLFAHPQP